MNFIFGTCTMRNALSYALLLVIISVGAECGAAQCASALPQQLEQEMTSILDVAATDEGITSTTDFILLLESGDGRKFNYSHGQSRRTTPYESASTSKLPTAVIILTLVDQGYLSLSSKPADLISFWTGESSVTLRHLLSFTSGFNAEATCVHMPNADFKGCVQKIYEQQIGSQASPGTTFHYANSHLQIAGLMAVNAAGRGWREIFAEFQAQTGLFTHSAYDLPSSTNPRLAGGMHWTADDYQAFLHALYWNKRPKDNRPLLNQESYDMLFSNQRGIATVSYSPIWQSIQEDWSYGLGNWIECQTAKTTNSFNCPNHRVSCPGSYGAYPFIDFNNSYFGIVARQGNLATEEEGIHLFRTIQECAERWANGKGTTLQQCIAGDLDCNKMVDILDLILVANSFGKSSGFDIRADPNKDNAVNVYDLVIVGSNFGKTG